LLQSARREAAAMLDGVEVSTDDMNRAQQHMKKHWQKSYGLAEVG
jgi:hypothetical protein